MKPPSSTEAREIHQTILSMTADPLHLQLRAIASQDPHKQVAPAVADALGPYLSLKRSSGWVPQDLQLLTASSRGLLTSIRHAFHHLLDWSTSLEVNTSPPKFSFKLVTAAVHLHGAPKVLQLFLRELKMLIGTDRLDAGLDMLTAVIYAPCPSTKSMRCASLRDTLRMSHADLAKTLKAGDTFFAEAVVRLHQRVETFAAAVPQRALSLNATTSMDPNLANMDLQNINLDAAAGNADIDVGALGVQPSSEDIDQILEGAAGMDNYGPNNMGSGTDDVFGLEGGDMQMMNFDDMDLGMF